MKNAIIILNYNDSDNTKKILKKIKNYKILDYIIVVDNKSTDDSLKKLKNFENEKIKIVLALHYCRRRNHKSTFKSFKKERTSGDCTSSERA